MRELLTIGEAARLVGVTPKTVRHYHKVGLMAEPARSEGGYRLYGAQDLLRLQRIRRLRSLGLSLKQVGSVLGEPGSEAPLWEVLEGLLTEVRAEIERPEERRERIARLTRCAGLADEGLREAQRRESSLSIEADGNRVA